MKKIFAMILCLCLTLSLAACGASDGDKLPKAEVNFPELSWGMSVEQVQKAYPGAVNQKSDGGEDAAEFLTLTGTDKVLGESADLTFTFLKGGEQYYLCTAKAEFAELADVDTFAGKIESAAGVSENYRSATTNDFTDQQKAMYEKNVAYTHHAEYPMAMNQIMVTGGKGNDGQPAYTLNLMANFWVLGNIQMYPN